MKSGKGFHFDAFQDLDFNVEVCKFAILVEFLGTNLNPTRLDFET